MSLKSRLVMKSSLLIDYLHRFTLCKNPKYTFKKEGKVVALRFKRNSIVYSTKLVLKELI